MTTWQAQLQQLRRQSFVGRHNERRLFADALRSEQWPFFVLYLFGPGGVGKSSLLHQYAHMASEHHVRVLALDARAIEPQPESFLHSLCHLLNLTDDDDPVAYFNQRPERYTLLFDTYELAGQLDNWLRERFLPALPQTMLVVMAGRTPPSPAWRQDPGWQQLMRVQPLRNLSYAEAGDFLTRRNVPTDSHESAVSLTGGHPLALSLVADLFAQHPQAQLDSAAAADIIARLVERLAEEAPGPRYRQALEASSVVHVTTEPLLATLLDTGDAGDLFDWLRNLSLMEINARGIMPHDLVRDALVQELRWRNPQRYATLQARAQTYYTHYFASENRRGQRRVLIDFMFLQRDNPLIQPYFSWQVSDLTFTDRVYKADHQIIVDLVQRYEGPRSAQLARGWLTDARSHVAIIRGPQHAIEGVLITLRVNRDTFDEQYDLRDPALDALQRFLQQVSPLQADEVVLYFRFWLSRDDYQDVSSTQSRIFLNMVQQYLITPGLAYSILPCADPDFWQPIFAYAGITRRPDLDFEIDGRRYGTFMRDWRSTSPLAWLAALGGRQQVTPPGAERPVTLDPDAFGTAVRDALRLLNDPVALADNPLLKTALLVNTPGDERIDALQQLLRNAVDELAATPRQRKWQRALYHAYVQPAPTQEAAAELLDLPYSTFRRHLKLGVDHVVARLWADAN